MSAITARRHWLLLLVLCMNLLLVACATDRNSQLQRLSRFAPEVLYDEARRALRAHDYNAAVARYSALAARYPFTPEARQARLDLIYAYYKLDEKESARDAADTFLRENPAHPSVDYAHYVLGLVEFERTPHKLELWLGGDPDGRAPQTARESIESFRTVVTEYPNSIYAADAYRRMIYMRNRLAEYELRVANYYMQRGAWVAAAQRARLAIEQYDGAPAIKDALRIMIMCYRRLEYSDLADNTLKIFQENFPGESAEYQIRGKSGLFARLFNRNQSRETSADTRW